jgi:hypothetical protein
MSTIVTRSGKGSPLTHTEVDDNFTNLNTDKYQSGDAVSFTTLTATGQTSLGGAAGAEGLRVNNVASAVNYLSVYGRATSLPPRLFAEGGDSSIGISFSTKGSSPMLFSTNTGTQQFAISHTASAVNYVQVTGAATTATPVISVQGSDASIPLALQSKSVSPIVFQNGSAQRQFRIDGNGVGTNYFGVASSATAFSPVFGVATQSGDTNVSAVFQSKGTGAIDLAAGSSGVNISNGGTVTAITRTAAGASYTSFPSVAVSAPTTAGGVQATASVTQMLAGNPTTIQAGGTGYTVNDTLTVVGGTPTGSSATYTVTAVSGGVVTAVTALNFASYSALPTNPVSVTGGTGSGCTLNLTYGIASGQPTITNAGSGYVEQPTVTFSGGGGSGAAAYATVGSTPKIQSLGTNLSFYTPGGEQFRIAETTSGLTAVNFIQTSGNSAGAAPRFLGVGADTNVGLVFSSKGTGDLSFRTNGTNQVQLLVSHTASAVNYVQVTGAATGSSPTISSQGSDANLSLVYQTKGFGSHQFRGYSGSNIFANIYAINASPVNYLQLGANTSGNAPAVQSAGSDTNIDLTLTPKGTGVVKTASTGLQLVGLSSGYVGLKGASAAGSTTYTLPAADGSSGQALTTNGTGTLSWSSAGGGATGVSGQVFTSGGTFTIPSGVTAVKVTVVGGGGGGGSSSGTYYSGGGGGSGGAAITYLTGLTPSATLAVAIGAAGAAGATGGTSTVSSGTQSISTISATGGGAGGTGAGTAGGAGGSASGGSINLGGGSGTASMYATGYVYGTGGNGGDSILGGGGGGSTYATAGRAGATNSGGGGSGAGGGGGGSGGAGGSGVVIFEW